MRKLNLLLLFLLIPALVILISCSDNPVTPVQTDDHIYELYQNYPNPFNEITKIKFAISQTSFVNMKLINSGGNEIAVLLNQNLNAGLYEVILNGEKIPGGMYYYTLTVTTDSSTYSFKKQMELIK